MKKEKVNDVFNDLANGRLIFTILGYYISK